MSKEIYEWSDTAAENIFTPADGGTPELMARSDVNNASRARMATMRSWHDDMEWQTVRTQGPLGAGVDIGTFVRSSTSQFTITLAGTSLSKFFPLQRLIKIIDGQGTGTDLITQVVGVSYLNDVTTVSTTTSTSKEMHADSSDVLVYFSATARGQVFEERESLFFIPESNDSEGIQAAIDAASDVNGGTVLLTNNTYSIDAVITIDSSQGQVIIQGALPETVLRMTNGVNLDHMFFIDQGNALFTFKDLRFNNNRTNNPTGNSYCVEIDDTISLAFENCQFADCERALNFTGTGDQRTQIRNCKFISFQEFGIKTSDAVSLHRGHIVDCMFDGAQQNVAASSAIKVAGEWIIANNYFLNCGDVTITPIAIWLWNKTTSENGGHESVIIGNNISCDNGTNGWGIQVGGDDLVISGNRIIVGATGIGIYVNGSAAGQTLTRHAITGNMILGGTACIHLTERTSNIIVSGNTLSPTNVGVICYGNHIMISGNKIKFGTTGIQINSVADDCSIMGNDINVPTVDGIVLLGDVDNVHISANRIHGSPTDGIDISATATDTVIENNFVAGSATNEYNGPGVRTARMGNSFDNPVVYEAGTYDIPFTNSGSLINYSGSTGIALPNGGRAGRYLIALVVFGWEQASQGGSVEMEVFTGPNGTVDDTARCNITEGWDADRTAMLSASATFTAGNDDVLFGIGLRSFGGSLGVGAYMNCTVTKLGNV